MGREINGMSERSTLIIVFIILMSGKFKLERIILLMHLHVENLDVPNAAE